MRLNSSQQSSRHQLGVKKAASRPKNLNLFTIHLPLPALSSILHRISGVLLYLITPFLIALLQISLQSPAGFEHVKRLLHSPFIMVCMVVFIWTFIYHSLAGLRHLLLEMQVLRGLAHARISSLICMVLSFIMTVFFVMQYGQ